MVINLFENWQYQHSKQRNLKLGNLKKHFLKLVLVIGIPNLMFQAEIWKFKKYFFVKANEGSTANLRT